MVPRCVNSPSTLRTLHGSPAQQSLLSAIQMGIRLSMKPAAQTSGACSGGRGRGEEATGGMKQRALGIANHS